MTYGNLPLHTRAVAERFEIKASEYTKLERIGEGGVGQVNLCFSLHRFTFLFSNTTIHSAEDLARDLAWHTCCYQGTSPRRVKARLNGPHKVLDVDS